VRTTATNRRLRVLITALREGTLLPRPEFQRRLVWSTKHKLYFLQTVLMGYPFPEIYVAAGSVDPVTAGSTEMLVDGQQRLATLYQYFIGSTELALGKDIPPYLELTPEQKLSFLEYDVVVRDLGSMSIDAIKDVFLRINSTNYAVNAMETHNARFEGEFKKFGEEVAELPFFDVHKVFSNTDVKRMQDLRYVLVMVVTLMSTYFNRDDEIELYLEKYNDDFPQRDTVREEVLRVLSFIENCAFDPRSRAWKKADLFTLIVELHRKLIREGDDMDVRTAHQRVEHLYRLIDANAGGASLFAENADNAEAFAEYYKASIQATNDRSSRIRRGEILRQALDGRFANVPVIAS
jgi:uncharacterized protein with ParB-like and HNH nuclease domain